MRVNPSIPILVLAFGLYAWVVWAEHSSSISFFAWMVSAAVCLAWGTIVSSRNRRLGWICVAVTAAQLILAILPSIISRRVY
jgi:drug/metabolite transporter (DMT)-like permease